MGKDRFCIFLFAVVASRNRTVRVVATFQGQEMCGMLFVHLGGCHRDTGYGRDLSSRGCGVLEGTGVLDVDHPGRPSGRPEIAGSEAGVRDWGVGASEGTGRVGAICSLFLMLVCSLLFGWWAWGLERLAWGGGGGGIAKEVNLL